MIKPALKLHILEELDDPYEYAVEDLVNVIRDSKEEIKQRFVSLRHDIDTVVALEDFITDIKDKEAITKADVAQYQKLVDHNETSYLMGMSYKQVSLEGFDTLINTGSSVAKLVKNTASNVASAVNHIKDGVVAGAKLASFLYTKVQSAIVSLAASWDMVCALIEKRWLGLKQLVEVYDLQYDRLYTAYSEATKESDKLANFSVKLYASKLRNDGRDISDKHTLLKTITEDSFGISALGDGFIKSVQKITQIDSLSNRALTLREPYRKTLAINANTTNEIIKEFTNNMLFTNGGFVKNNQAQSRVLLGGKVIYVNYNDTEMAEDTPRKEFKRFVGSMSFASIKRRDGSTNDTELIEFTDVTVAEAGDIFGSVYETNAALRRYFESNIPATLRGRQTITSLTTFATGMVGGNAAFDSIKRFFNNDENLKAFNLVAPVPVAKLLGTFLGASSFAVFGGIVAAAAAAFLIDYLRKYIISGMFSMMDIQYKITNIMEQFDSDFIDTVIEIHNQGHRVCKKLASSRSW